MQNHAGNHLKLAILTVTALLASAADERNTAEKSGHILPYWSTACSSASIPQDELFMHLTNYSINKHNENFDKDDSDDSGSKRWGPLTKQVNRHAKQVNRHTKQVNRHAKQVNRHAKQVNRHAKQVNRHAKQ